MSFANIWLGLEERAQTPVIARLRHNEERDGPYTGPVSAREYRIFRYMSDQENVQRLFKRSRIGARNWSLWSISFTENLPKVKQELDWLVANRGSMVSIAGAWGWDGAQKGTKHVWSTRTVTKTWSVLNPDYQPDAQEPAFDPRFVLRITGDVEEDYISGFTGTPVYPVPLSALLKFMPDVGDPPVTATVLADVNLLSGQSPRRFS